MSGLITICVTSFNRPELLKEAIESCLRQTYRPLEIIVGDDSRRDNFEFLIKAITFDTDVEFHYRHQSPPLGEARNVDAMFRAAKGARLLLLHDDDLLCDDALDRLDRAWTMYPGVRCVFGKYITIDASGRAIDSQTTEQNAKHFRTASSEGRQSCPLKAGLQQQFPHNGYLVETDLARAVGYRSSDVVGLCADFDFGIRIGGALRGGEMVYIDHFISKYRLSFPSTLRANPNLGEHLLFRSIQAMSIAEEAEQYREQALMRIARGAGFSAALSGDVKFLSWMMTSRYYRKHLLSSRMVLCLLAVLSPSLATKVWLRRQGRSGGPESDRAVPPVGGLAGNPDVLMNVWRTRKRLPTSDVGSN